MGSIATSFEGSLFCERCGQQFAPKELVCVGCGTAPVRHWLQLTSLATFLAAAVSNSLVAWFLLPHLLSGNRPRLFRVWFWLDQKASLYGWVPIILGILAWDYFVWHGAHRPRQTQHKIKSWVTRKLLTFVLVTSVAPILPWWIPAGQPPDSFLARISRLTGPCRGEAQGHIRGKFLLDLPVVRIDDRFVRLLEAKAEAICGASVESAKAGTGGRAVDLHPGIGLLG